MFEYLNKPGNFTETVALLLIKQVSRMFCDWYITDRESELLL